MFWERVRAEVVVLFLRLYLVVVILAAPIVYMATGRRDMTFAVVFVGISLFGLGFLVQRIRAQRRLRESGIEDADKMSGVEFEEFLLQQFAKRGYQGYLTSTTDDYGADLILQKDGRRIAVQAKRWNSTVGIKAVQEIIGAAKYYSADKGMVVTNSTFTENAFELAKANGVELWGRKELVRFLLSQKGSVPQEAVPEDREDQCPQCGSSLIRKKGKYGPFLGCSGYPACKFSTQLSKTSS